MAMRPYLAAVAGIRPSHPQQGMHRLWATPTTRRPTAPYAPDLQRRRALGRRADQKPPGKTPTLKGSNPEAESCNLSGLGPSRGSGYLSGVARRYVLPPFQGRDAAETVTRAYNDADFGHESTRLANINLVLVFVYTL